MRRSGRPTKTGPMTFESKSAPAFVRSSSDRMISGVCGGVAEYFGWDASLVRAATVIAAFFSFGTVAVVYIVAWLLMPQG